MNFDKIVNEYFPDKLVNKSYRSIFEDSNINGSMESLSMEGWGFPEPVKEGEHNVQKMLRPLFGKDGIREEAIGYHPDYQHLGGTDEMVNGYVCTLFLDIAKSSRLNLIYDIRTASIIKNRILQLSIEVIRAFDGYPHRMMGDAIMAFFGDQNTSKEQAAIDSINCASVLKNIIVNHLVDKISEDFGEADSKLGIRIGINYGSEEEVVWGAFGYSSAYEITAHGLSIDLCPKLQSMAGKNNIMLGEGLFEFIDFPEDFLKFKETNGKVLRHVVPNITDANKNKIFYGCKILRFDDYYSLMPFDPQFKGLSENSFGILFYCEFYNKDIKEWMLYRSLAKPLEKSISLRFTLLVPVEYFSSLAVSFKFEIEKINHGKEAEGFKQRGKFQKSNDKINQHTESFYFEGKLYKKVVVYEDTAYRGVHQMNVKGRFLGMNETRTFENKIGVFVA